MRRINIGKLVLFAAATFSLFSCHKEEDFQSMEEGVLPMVLKGEVRSYDENTKVGDPLSFNNGATLYVRLENGTSIVLGTATYNSEKEAWTFTYSGSIAGWSTVSAKCYYIPNYINSSRTLLTLDYNYPIYSDESASMAVAPGAVTLTAHLTPHTGRLSLGRGLLDGVNKNVKLLKGLSYYTGFRLNDYSLTSVSDPEISFAATNANYFYGYFTSKDNPSILLQYGLYQYSRSFGADTPVLKAGHSGYLTVPSSYSHEGWTIENEMEPETDEITVGNVTFKMVTIPGGSFSMGMDGIATPVHDVTLDEFQLGETEVTQELWEAVMGNNPCSFYGQPNLPVETVSYWDIQLFLFRLRGLTGKDFRLPTEAEWEYAARESMGSPLLYSGSDIIADVGWYGDNSDDSTHPVKQKGANGLGLYDMSGNVWEVVCDWGYYDYPSDSQINPRGYAWGSGPVRRGGSYLSENANECRVAARDYWSAYSGGSSNMGFRLALGGPKYEPEMVDLALPSGLKWASFNLGATRPIEIGYYFAWGETEPKSSYNWDNYVFMQNGQSDEWHVNKYTYEDGYSSDGTWYEDGVFVGDGQKVLNMDEDDAARALWGDQWRIPTPTDWQELKENCNISWSYSSGETSGLATLIVTSKTNGNSIYLPATGYFNSDGLQNVSSYYYYLPSNTVGYASYYAQCARLGNAFIDDTRSFQRYQGMNIRPVSGDGNNYIIEVSVDSEEGISFGMAAVGNTGYRTFTVTNTGALPFPVKATCEGTGFSVSPSGDITIPVGRTQEYTVSFTPTADGEYDGSITLSSIKQPEDKVISLSGTGNVIDATEYTVNGVSFKMISIPGGTFNMGKENYATPVHQVKLDNYSIGETEVTQELWQAVMGNNPSSHTGVANLPVENVSWFDAQAFIGRLNNLTGGSFHLPTEAEWEYAAREAGSDYYLYSGSNTVGDVSWYSGNSDDETHPVKLKKANAFGLYDMSGNVWEWCMDCYADYPGEDLDNPLGNAYGSPLTRGGDYSNSYSYSVVYRRHWDSASGQYQNHGFRLALGGATAVQPEMVDLGLPSGLKWASFNLGANRPADIGYFFAWGEALPKTIFNDWSSYKWMQDGGSDYTSINKYAMADENTSGIWYQNGAFVGDGLSVLEAEDDAASVLWGDSWRSPSPADYQELIDECTWNYTSISGMYGMEVVGPNGNSIFIPGAGYLEAPYYYNVDYGYYLSSSLHDTQYASYLYFSRYNEKSVYTRERHKAYSIRPVSGAGNNYDMQLSSAEINFSNAPLNDASERVFQVKNTGYLPITVSITSDNTAFVVSPDSFTIPAKQNKEITVTLTPTEATTYSGTLTITPTEFATVSTVSLNGTGINMVYETYSVGGVEFKMVPVPGGTFDMGMDAGRQVTLDDFYIGQTEVTQELWTVVMGSNPSIHTGEANRPVENITWFDAKVFIERLNALTGEHFRLPTEAEWEYAARGGSAASHNTYSGGNDLDAIAWYSTNSNSTTHPVKTKAPNELGIYDMSGNVWEWLEGFYGSLPNNGDINPRGNAWNSNSANFRGGAFNSIEDCSVTHRGDYLGASGTSDYLGFRIAMGGPSYLPEAIDMGTGVKWASFNLGAGAEGELGYYYAWGEVLPKKEFDIASYQHGDGTSHPEGGVNSTKYNATDQLYSLQQQDDAAAMSLGNGWRMPTSEEWNALIDNSTRTQETVNGLDGIRLTSNINGNSIFLPACGFRYGSGWGDWMYYINTGSHYWTSSLYEFSPYSDAHSAYMYASDNVVSVSGLRRHLGCPIRPVHD